MWKSGFLIASISPTGDLFHNMIQGLLALAGVVSAVDIRLLPSQFSFQSDGSTTEGRGVVTVNLGPEYTGQTTPVQDYSVSFWYQGFFGGSATFYSIQCNSL